MKRKRIIGIMSVLIIILGGILIGTAVNKNSAAIDEEEARLESVAAEKALAESESRGKKERLKGVTPEFAKWVADANALVQGELDDPRIAATDYDEGFTYYLKSKALNTFKTENNGIGENEIIHKDLSNVFMHQSILGHLQFSRTSEFGLNGEAIEAIEHYEHWQPTNDDMRIAFDYLKQILHDLDVAINHDGEGKTYGVTHLMNGDKVAEMEAFW